MKLANGMSELALSVHMNALAKARKDAGNTAPEDTDTKTRNEQIAKHTEHLIRVGLGL